MPKKNNKSRLHNTIKNVSDRIKKEKNISQNKQLPVDETRIIDLSAKNIINVDKYYSTPIDQISPIGFERYDTNLTVEIWLNFYEYSEDDFPNLSNLKFLSFYVYVNLSNHGPDIGSLTNEFRISHLSRENVSIIQSTTNPEYYFVKINFPNGHGLDVKTVLESFVLQFDKKIRVTTPIGGAPDDVTVDAADTVNYEENMSRIPQNPILEFVTQHYHVFAFQGLMNFGSRNAKLNDVIKWNYFPRVFVTTVEGIDPNAVRDINQLNKIIENKKVNQIIEPKKPRRQSDS